MRPLTRHTIIIIIFSIAMAALESAVVAYLRALYYPDGFTVAFRLINSQILLIEIVREAATLIMIWAVAHLTGKNRLHRFAYFLLCFAVWDIFYYVWLKVFIGWPSPFFEWDILFLIPYTWVGPVLSPVIVSITMIIFANVLLFAKREIKFTFLPVVLLSCGVLLILYTYLYDYGQLILKHDLTTDYFQLLSNEKFITLASNYIPNYYNWTTFCLGEGAICITILRFYLTSHSSKKLL